jgi:hypothetical protein
MKRIFFRLLLIAIGLAILEGGSWLLLAVSPQLRGRMQTAAAGEDPSARGRAQAHIGHLLPKGVFLEEVVHPYFGVGVIPPARALVGPLSLDALGFPNGGPFEREHPPNSVVIGIFGGSVAAYFAKSGGVQAIFEQLKTLPAFAGKRLVALTGAHIGMKQPQSLMALSFLQALGVDFDVVILLDGFNEVVNAPFDLVPAGVFPFYPSQWNQRVANLELDTTMRSRIGELAYLKERRADGMARLLASPLRNSHSVELLWALYDRSLETTIEAKRAQLDTHESDARHDYTATGPQWPHESEDALSADLAAFWFETSLQMRALAEAKGALFFHFLQPNQHVPGSKPMDTAEQAVAIRGGEAFAPHVTRGYRFLRERGTQLAAQGVHFHDLTQLFAETTEPIYIDNIGHLGGKGNEMMAAAMAAQIVKDLAGTAP